MRTGLVVGGAVVVVAGAAAVTGVVTAEGDEPTAETTTEPTSTATVRRGDLVETTAASGALEYADSRELASELAGTITWLPATGKVVEEGEALYRVDTVPVLRMDGKVPAWRALGPDVSDGADVRQLEKALLDLGYGEDYDMAADGEWTWVTTHAVEELQEDLGLEETGELPLGSVVFSEGDLRVSGRLVETGSRVQAATPVVEVTDVDRRVTVDLEPSQRHLAPVGGPVDLEFTDGTAARGRIVDVELVPATEEQEETLRVTVEPHGKRSEKRVGAQLDGASVQASFTDTLAEEVLIVPVTALVAVEDGYAVEVVDDDSTRLVPVTTHGFADTSVAVEGDLAAGDEVVVP